jgi:DNA adenine methylase
MFPYIGGKKQHSKWIDPLFPTNFKTYVEVFGGAFWMYWMSKKTPAQINVYNDFNRHLYNVFTCASTDPKKFEIALKNLYPSVGNAAVFEQFRDQIFQVYNTNFVTPDYDLAAKYMFLQTQFFTGGLGLHEKTKIYSNPKYKSKFYTYTEKFSQQHYLDRLDVMTTENMDCRAVITKYDHADTFFYIDPPYFNLEDYYTKNSFGREDHIELLTQMSAMKGKFALSYYYFKELEDIMPRDKFYWHEQITYSNNGLTKVEGAVRKDGKSAKGVRPERVEVLILNYQPQPIVPVVSKRKKIIESNLFTFE